VPLVITITIAGTPSSASHVPFGHELWIGLPGSTANPVLVIVSVEVAGVVPMFRVDGLNPQVTAGELVEHVRAAATAKSMLPVIVRVTFAECPELIVTVSGFAVTIMVAETVVVGSLEELLLRFTSPPPETAAVLVMPVAALLATFTVIVIAG